MKLSKIRYAFSEARKSIVRNGLMSFASLFTIACCLLILGVFAIITVNVNHVADQIKDQCEIQVYINTQASDQRVDEIGDEIERIDNIKDITLVTKEETLEYAKKEMFADKEDMLAGFDEDNPFADSYKVVLMDIKSTAEAADRIGKIEGVDTVINKQDVVNTVLSLSGTVRIFSVVIMVILLMIAMVIISNTVKLTVFNRRREINIMKYIGATDRFIKVPFVLEGFIIGFLAAVVAFLVAGGGYWALLKYTENVNFNIVELAGMNMIAPVIAILFVVFGSLIGVIGSAVSVRKHLQV